MVVLGLQGQPHPLRAFEADIRGAWDCGWYHNSAAVLLKDGVVVAAIEEERLTRRKHTGKMPLRALRACLDAAGCAPDSVDMFAFGEEGGPGDFRDRTIDVDELATILQQELGLTAIPRSRVKVYEHHLCHAISAYAASGYGQSLILTADGFGDGVAGYVMQASGRRLDLLDQIAVADSLGAFYQAPLALLGFGAHDEFKMMGLAPYGDPQTYRPMFSRAYRLKPDGRFQLDRGALLRGLADLGPTRRHDEPFTRRDYDVAAAAQAALEDLVFHVLRHYRRLTGQRALCCAGGVMQNSSLNGKLARSGLFDRIFVQPASGDSGLALGAAYFAYLQHAGNCAPVIARQEHVFLGSAVPAPDVVGSLLQRWAGLVSFQRSEDIVRETASRLAAGQVVGWVQGRAEFGPRALGNRSILADPRDPANKDRINAKVKKREAFRPFAPAVRSEDAARYFELPLGVDCSFMTMVVPVRMDCRKTLGATTHVDGTARVQVVERSSNPLFWQLIDAFGKETGVPVVLNTSFNNNHEPIVDSVDDAIACFLTTELDALAIGPFLVRKTRFAPPQLLRLVPHLCDDACLASGWTSPPDGASTPFYMLLTGNRQLRISPAAHRTLAAGGSFAADQHHTGRMDGKVSADARALADELMALWELRVIHMRPGTGRKYGTTTVSGISSIETDLAS